MKCNVKSLLSYILALLFVFIYSFTFGGKSILIFYMVLVGGVLEIILFLYIKNKISFEVVFPSDEVEKGEEIVMVIKYKNASYIPSPTIDVSIESNERIEIKNGVISILLNSGEEGEMKRSCIPLFRGIGSITIEKANLNSYLGFFYIDILENIYIKEKSILIIPNIVNILNGEALYNNKLRSLDEYTALNENIILGDPSYEFRNYIPGESLSMVNWKLSSKKGTLMIREREHLLMPSYKVIINPYIERNNAEIEDILIEGCIGLCKEFYKNNYETTVELFINNKWSTYSINNDESLIHLQKILAKYEFISNSVPIQTSQDNEIVYMFSYSTEKHIEGVNTIIPHISNVSNSLFIPQDTWIIYNNMEIERGSS